MKGEAACLPDPFGQRFPPAAQKLIMGQSALPEPSLFHIF